MTASGRPTSLEGPGATSMLRPSTTGPAASSGSDVPPETTETFWSVPLEELLATLDPEGGGLSSAEAAQRLSLVGPARLAR